MYQSYKNGCQWVGELRHVDEHLKTCDYVKLRCPNRCGESSEIVLIEATQFFRKVLQKHLRTNVHVVSTAAPTARRLVSTKLSLDRTLCSVPR